jgi:replicative DNA helicase
VDWNEFSQWFLMVKHPMYSHAQQEVYRTHFKLLAEAPSNEGLEEQIVAAFLERSIAAAIALIADQVADGSERLSLVDVDARMEEWHKAQANLDDADEEDWEMGELVDLIDGKGGYTWRLKELNMSLGPVGKGDLILFGARPNVGKTTMVMSEVGFMAQQIRGKGCVLSYHNEEGPTAKIRLRWMQSVLGWTSAQVKADPVEALALYTKMLKGKDRIRVVHNPGGSFGDFEALCLKYKPSILVCDQLRLCTGYEKSATEVERLKELYRRARVVASTYGPFFTVHQASDAAHGKLYPTDNMLEGVRTEVQGALDGQVMIGAEDPTSPVRGVSVVKNKLLGGPECVEALRHGRFPVSIDPTIARFKGMT